MVLNDTPWSVYASESPIKYKKSPPTLGEDTSKILKNFLKLNAIELGKLKKNKII